VASENEKPRDQYKEYRRPGELLASEVARTIGVSITTIQKWTRLGYIKARAVQVKGRPNGVNFYTHEDVKAALKLREGDKIKYSSKPPSEWGRIYALKHHPGPTNEAIDYYRREWKALARHRITA
jgi:transposase